MPRASLPALVALHGYGSTADGYAGYSGLSGRADRSGFVVVYAQALGETPEWHLTNVPSDHPEYRTSDRSFITAIVDWLASTGCVDTGRVFLAGHSQGGGMSADMACDLGSRLAGIGLVSALRVQPICDGLRPIPTVVFHALDDPVLPYAGGHVQGTPGIFPDQLPVDETLRQLADRNGCGGSPAETPLEDGSILRDWQGCGAPLRFYQAPSGGHDWLPTTADRLWSFFSTLPPRG